MRYSLVRCSFERLNGDVWRRDKVEQVAAGFIAAAGLQRERNQLPGGQALGRTAVTETGAMRRVGQARLVRAERPGREWPGISRARARRPRKPSSLMAREGSAGSFCAAVDRPGYGGPRSSNRPARHWTRASSASAVFHAGIFLRASSIFSSKRSSELRSSARSRNRSASGSYQLFSPAGPSTASG